MDDADDADGWEIPDIFTPMDVQRFFLDVDV